MPALDDKVLPSSVATRLLTVEHRTGASKQVCLSAWKLIWVL